MASDERELIRKKKRAKKNKKNKIIIWSIIGVIILILAVMKIWEIDINTAKEHFTDENGNFTITQGITDDNFPYSLDSSRDVTLVNVNKKIGILTPVSFTVLDSGDGETEYSFDHGYSNPIMRNSGIYTLIYDQGTTSMRLDTTSDNVYETDTENDIFCADVAKNGSVVYAATSSEKKCDIKVYSRSLEEKHSYSTSSGYPVAVAISDSADNIAFVTANSENTQLKYTIYTMSVGSNEITAEAELPQGNVIRIEYSSNNIYIIGDDYLCVMTNQKKLTEIYSQGEINTVSYTFTPSNELVIVYNSYDNSTDNVLARIKSNGKIKSSCDVSGTVKSVSASSNAVSVLKNGKIITYKLSNLKKTQSVAVSDSAKSICRMGSNVYIHRQSLLERGNSE
ncbi:MAG: DUF5711 family protein [Clostridiales bacterium]|nr:DUF5711 family protein [Clostridiales bacterium]